MEIEQDEDSDKEFNIEDDNNDSNNNDLENS